MWDQEEEDEEEVAVEEEEVEREEEEDNDDDGDGDGDGDDSAKKKGEEGKSINFDSDEYQSAIIELIKPCLDEEGCDTDYIRFVVIDVFLRPCASDRSKTEAVLVGRGENGGSVCIFAEGWQPYLYIQAPRGWKDEFKDVLKELIEEKLQSRLELRYNGPSKKKYKGAKNNPSSGIYDITTVMRKSIFGYIPGGPLEFLKIEVAHPFLVRSLLDVFEGYDIMCSSDNKKKVGFMQGVSVLVDFYNDMPKVVDGKTQTFNSNLDPVIQFMVDVGLFGCQWCKVAKKKNDEGQSYDQKRSFCHYENKIHIRDLTLLSIEECNDLGPLRVLSFDIEAAGRRGVFPDASFDPVIQIALHFYVLGGGGGGSSSSNEKEKRKFTLQPILLSLRKCDSIEGAIVLSFDNELEMLNCFTKLVVAFDADVLTGYNICNFDFPYLLKRAATLGGGDDDNIQAFKAMTRLQSSPMFIRETVFQSAQTGKRKRVRVGIAGRVCLDMFTCIQNNQSFRLEKYTLNAVSEYFLGDKKVDLPFTQITPMWEKDSASRKELGIYCLKDAQLPIDLMTTLDSLTQVVEMARCTGTPFDYILQRGVMIRNTSLLLRRALERLYVFPNIKAGGGGGRSNGFEGATVLDAHAGIHRNVGVLDFAAMYPSIIRAHNLCYSTIILDPANEPPSLSTHHHHTNNNNNQETLLRVSGHCFVSEEIVKGLIPEVVEILQDCRTKAKKAYAAATDPVKKKTCKAREMAFKVAGNGMYGALGSTQSLLPLLAVAETVTAIGREDIKKVKGLAEKMYSDALVVYGDTDSVFVRFCIPPPPINREASRSVIEEVSMAMDMATALAAKVNLIMKAPKKIEFEKVYSTMICLSKKRYAGVMYAAGHKFGIDEPPIDIKGMQCVRRDGCSLMRDLVRECLMSILYTGTFVEAAALARLRLIEIMDDKIPVDAYAVQKVLRKSMQDCCHPMTALQVQSIKKELGSSSPDESLSYAEQDEAIRKKIDLPWRLKIRLPHIMLAWRMRLKDPGNAPVLGETISYVVTNNGGKQIFEKVNTLEDVKSKKLFVDRKYYLDSLRVPLENIFLPVCIQNFAPNHTLGSAMQKKQNEARGKLELENLIWRVVKTRALKYDSVSRRESIESSPIFKAFKRHAAATSSANDNGK